MGLVKDVNVCSEGKTDQLEEAAAAVHNDMGIGRRTDIASYARVLYSKAPIRSVVLSSRLTLKLWSTEEPSVLRREH